MPAKKSSCNAKPKAKRKTKATAEGIPSPAVIDSPAKPRPDNYTTGRPTDYDPSYPQQALKLYQKGWTDIEVADFFGVSDRTLYRWQAAHEEFSQSIKLGKESPDDRTERSLYHRANGFEWVEQQAIKLREETWVDGNKEVSERIEIVDVRKRVPPDTAASIFWLTNRRKDAWRQRQEFSGPDGSALMQPVIHVTTNSSGST